MAIGDLALGHEQSNSAAESAPRRIVNGSNTITDPEGYRIELFQSAPEPAGK